MSRARHHAKHKAGGGRIGMKVAGNPDVFEEASDKHGTKRKHGGKVKHVGHAEGHASHRRMDKPGRKRGGRVGADTSPLSSAHRSTSAGSSPKTQQGGMSE